MRRLKQLEDENAKLRKLVADLALDREMLQGVIRRKIEGLVASASSSAWSVVSGRCRSGGPVRSWSSTCRATTTNRAGPTRPPWQPGSRRSARPVSAMAIVVSTCRCGARLSEDDPGRSGFRVRQPRPRPVGLCQGRHARLLPPGEANGSCLHRSVQRPLPQRVSEHALVPDACGCDRKDGGLGQILSRGSAAWAIGNKPPILLQNPGGAPRSPP